MNFRRILVRATNWVGDAVMSVPALQALRAAFPDAHISILAKRWVAGLYAREPFCDDIIPYQGLTWSTVRAIRSRKFDAAILLQNAFEAALLARLAGIPVRIGYNRDARGWLLTHPIPVPRPGEIPKHQRFYYLEMLQRAGIISRYNLDEPIRLTRTGSPENLVGVSPGAAYGGAKRWLPERFAAAAVTIARETGASVAVFGAPQERDICQAVADRVAAAGIPCVNYAGKTSIDDFSRAIARCEIYLTNDSGPMHIASALGVPTVAVFGATDDVATGPTGELSRVVRHPVECSPCLLRECPIDHRCMTRVEAQQVVDAALTLVSINGHAK